MQNTNLALTTPDSRRETFYSTLSMATCHMIIVFVYCPSKWYKPRPRNKSMRSPIINLKQGVKDLNISPIQLKHNVPRTRTRTTLLVDKVRDCLFRVHTLLYLSTRILDLYLDSHRTIANTHGSIVATNLNTSNRNTPMHRNKEMVTDSRYD